MESLVDEIIRLDTIQVQKKRYGARKKYNQCGMQEYLVVRSDVTEPRHEAHDFVNVNIRETR